VLKRCLDYRVSLDLKAQTAGPDISHHIVAPKIIKQELVKQPSSTIAELTNQDVLETAALDGKTTSTADTGFRKELSVLLVDDNFINLRVKHSTTL
jgi:hypothetical protein